MDTEKPKGGYYTVSLDVDGKKIPYVVFADSDFQAAHKVRLETGMLAAERDVEGPFSDFMRVPDIPVAPPTF